MGYSCWGPKALLLAAVNGHIVGTRLQSSTGTSFVPNALLYRRGLTQSASAPLEADQKRRADLFSCYFKIASSAPV